MKIWNYLSNTFVLIGKKSFAKALKISTHHLAQLEARKTDPFILPMYTTYRVCHTNLDGAYNIWKAQGGVQKGSTLSVKQLLKLLVDDKLELWEHAVLGVYRSSSPNYVALFPKGRSSFNSGTIDARVNAVGQLSVSLNGIDALEATKTDVDMFFAQLIAAREEQLGQKGGTESKSTDLEHAIEIAMIQMYGNLGLLMSHYKTDVRQIEVFFDLPTIRYQEQTLYKRRVNKNTAVVLIENTFSIHDRVLIKNDGQVPLGFYLAPLATTAVPETIPLVVGSGEEKLVSVSTLGDLSNRFLKSWNRLDEKGHCSIELM